MRLGSSTSSDLRRKPWVLGYQGNQFVVNWPRSEENQWASKVRSCMVRVTQCRTREREGHRQNPLTKENHRQHYANERRCHVRFRLPPHEGTTRRPRPHESQ